MPEIEGNVNPIIYSKREMDGKIVEKIAIQSFPGFYVTGNFYSPLKPAERNPAILCPHGHLADKRLREDVQKRSAVFTGLEAVVFAYDMVDYGEATQSTHKMPIAALL